MIAPGAGLYPSIFIMNRVSMAAIRVGRTVYTGRTHFEALRKILSSMSPDDATKAALEGEDGFVDTEGNFLTREQAFDLASAQKQISHPTLGDPDENVRFYGGPNPKLDSGILEGAPLRVRPSCLR